MTQTKEQSVHEQSCPRPGCTGKIVDGICEDCGRALPGGPPLLQSSNQRSETSGTSGTSPSGRTISSRRSSGRLSLRNTRRTLGAGLVSVEPLPPQDPLHSLLVNPVVPESKRHCPHCDAKLNLEHGYCPMCGTEYSFHPTLVAGDSVAGQYEIKGALAFGGLGWIYLAWDQALSRWVVLKGLLNSKDVAGASMALQERQFLAAVKQANIVGVYNFVTRGPEGYIVMEYIGGKTLKELRRERGPLPAAEAVAYIHRILSAFSYLHRMGLIYCDFKPDNIMLEDDDVKLIDMGGVRRADDLDSDIYGTKGYSAPEAKVAPTFLSDLYTVARTLAVLLIDFPFQGKYEFSLPFAAEEPLFGRYESLSRFLLKGTQTDPDERFQTADEMAEQLLGVLREIVAEAGEAHPAESTFFGVDTLAVLEDDAGLMLPSEKLLPPLKLDPLDPAAGFILAGGVVADPARRRLLYESAATQFPDSGEAPLRLALTQSETGAFAEAEQTLAGMESRDPFDWRVSWYRGRAAMAQREFSEAQLQFNRVYDALPGELVPKLALAVTAEMAGDTATALRLYGLVSRTDPGFSAAVFGLGRCREQTGDRAGAAEAYGRISASSGRYTQAQTALIRALIRAELAPPTAHDFVQASAAWSALLLEAGPKHSLAARILLTALHLLDSKALPESQADLVLGASLEETPLRRAAERELRTCARYAETDAQKIALIDQANQERPRTWL